jgi:hypothetical protein
VKGVLITGYVKGRFWRFAVECFLENKGTRIESGKSEFPVFRYTI